MATCHYIIMTIQLLNVILCELVVKCILLRHVMMILLKVLDALGV